ncbi:hypothetical protein EDD29_4154 [Actinocorallia herbida]|uniref:EthD domain-containing protein n=1 Tax=Actinocorallia herbida TaxID=58109 RepID=A0A3N1CZ68_9ACTN|nr:hypothetical protein [Actinocorallia herbida]ROO86581.1 hypothetical protein EDD29_4154 [Actinocorallia herbida]
MGRATLFAWSSPVPDGADAFAKWYDEVHIPDVRAAIPAIDRVVRHRVAAEPGSTDQPRFLTVYELADDDVAKAAAQLVEAAKAGRLRQSELMDYTTRPPVLEWAVVESAED